MLPLPHKSNFQRSTGSFTNHRDIGAAKLRHDHFMAKVPKVLGEEGAPKFRDTYTNLQNGLTYPCYRFPKREALVYHFKVQNGWHQVTATSEQTIITG